MVSKNPVQNQLLFNLDARLSDSNLSTKFHKPKQLIIEKVGTSEQKASSRHASATAMDPSSKSFHFKNLSEQRLSAAMQLAKRDLRKKRDEQLHGSVLSSPSRSRSPSPKAGRMKMIHGKEYCYRMGKWENKGKKVLRVKEHDRTRHPRSGSTQTPPRQKGHVGYMSPPGRLHPKNGLPVTTNSPPTRDTDSYPASSHNELHKIHLDMGSHLRKIYSVLGKIIQGENLNFIQFKPSKKEGYLAEEEDEIRKLIRTEEFTTRVLRNVYDLRQQVKDIETELVRAGTDKVKLSKKTHKPHSVINRLGAAHRGAFRILNMYVNQLPQLYINNGLPAVFTELAQLMRQLFSLSSQLDTGGGSEQDLICLLDNIDELSTAWSKKKEQSDQQKLKGEDHRRPLEQNYDHRVAPVRTNKHGKENRFKARAIVKKTNCVINKKKVHHAPRRANPFDGDTPERKEILQKGIRSLLAVGDDVEYNRSEHAGVSWGIPVEQPPPATKGLILPAKLKTKRQKVQRTCAPAIPESHFADPTHSASMKASVPLHNPITEERSASAPPSPRSSPFKENPWMPGGSCGARERNSTRRTRSQSPRLCRDRSWSPGAHRQRSRSPSPRRARFLKNEELIRKLYEEEGGKRVRIYDPKNLQRRARSPTRRRSPTRKNVSKYDEIPEYLAAEAEWKLKNRLQPLFEKAERSRILHESMSEVAEQSLKQKVAQRAFDNVELNADFLSDMIVNDVLNDTAAELQRLEESDQIRAEAVSMVDNPNLESLYHRLEEMEREQFDIRKRWKKVDFKGPSSLPSQRASQRNFKHADRPIQPAAFEIKNVSKQHIFKEQISAQINNPSEPHENPIIFTKELDPNWTTKRTYPAVMEGHLDEDMGHLLHVHPKATKISIPKLVVRSIKDNVDKYERYLKKISHQSLGKFDPWRLVEEVSDQLLEDCLGDVASELEQVNDLIVDNIYKSEFIVDKSKTQSPGSTPLKISHEQFQPAVFSLHENRQDTLETLEEDDISYRADSHRETQPRFESPRLDSIHSDVDSFLGQSSRRDSDPDRLRSPQKDSIKHAVEEHIDSFLGNLSNRDSHNLSEQLSYDDDFEKSVDNVDSFYGQLNKGVDHDSDYSGDESEGHVLHNVYDISELSSIQ